MDGSADKQDGREMAPRNCDDFPSGGDSNTKLEEADLQEMEALSESLDELSNVLDSFEARTDNIMEQLKELLVSNREIRQEFAKEKAAAVANQDSEGDKTAEKEMS